MKAASENNLHTKYVLDTTYAQRVTVAMIGREPLEHMQRVAPEVVAHNLAVGTLMYEFLKDAGCSAQTCEDGLCMGSLHDLGKVHEELLALSRSPRVFSSAEHAWFRREHTRRGAERVVELARPLSRELFGLVAFGAFSHHSSIPPEYVEGDPDHHHTRALGLLDVLQVCDVLHAVGFDKRAYVVEREGAPMTQVRVRDIVNHNRHGDPMVEGKVIPVHEFVSERLGLQP